MPFKAIPFDLDIRLCTRAVWLPYQNGSNQHKADRSDSPRIAAAVGEGHVPDALPVEGPEHRQGRVHAVAALHAQQGGDLPKGMGLFDAWNMQCCLLFG